jgi:hypothetical protein
MGSDGKENGRLFISGEIGVDFDESDSLAVDLF